MRWPARPDPNKRMVTLNALEGGHAKPPPPPKLRLGQPMRVWQWIYIRNLTGVYYLFMECVLWV